MGTWDKLPWDNDAAADWFAELFEKTKLAKHVEDTSSWRSSRLTTKFEQRRACGFS